jgi:prepilin-type processing-associated H-X9-DG protein
LGHLFLRGVVKDPKTFYCPDQATEIFTYPFGWNMPKPGIGISNPLNYYRCIGYLYRIGGQVSQGLTQQQIDDLASIRLGRPKQMKAMITDIVGQSGGGTWPHRKPYGVNVAYSDGHAEFVAMTEADYKRNLTVSGISTGVKNSDVFVYNLFAALDNKDFTALRLAFPVP